MKKALLLILIPFLLFSSCKSSNVKSSIYLNSDSLNTAFSFNDEYKGTINVEDNSLVIKISYPEIIKDVKFIVSDNCVSSSFGDVNVVQNNLTINGIFNELYDCVKILSSVSEFKARDNFLEYTDNDFTAILDSEGNLLTLETKSGKFSFT